MSLREDHDQRGHRDGRIGDPGVAEQGDHHAGGQRRGENVDDVVADQDAADQPLLPGVHVFVDDMAGPDVAEKVERRLRHWLSRKINALFEPMIAMRDDEAISGLARGVAFRIAEHFGIVTRREIAEDVKSLDQDARALLRKHGVRFGQHFIFMPALLKPAPTRMRLLLWNRGVWIPDH